MLLRGAPRPARRPNLSRHVRLIIRDLARRLPELRHVRAERILVVAGEARRTSRATIRPMRFPDGRRQAESGRRKPRVRFKGRTILYVITLRPLFFRASSPEKRLETILHELLHASVSFDGSLAPDRRHAVLRGRAFGALLNPLVKRYLASCPPAALDRLAWNGEVLVRQWIERPPNWYRAAQKVRRRYDETQTFLGPVRMITRQRH